MEGSSVTSALLRASGGGSRPARRWTLRTITEHAPGDSVRPALTRTNATDPLIVDTPDNYLIRPMRRYDADGQTVYARIDYFYDGSPSIDSCGNAFGSCKGVLTKKRIYRMPNQPLDREGNCTDPAVCVEYGGWYDATGNLIRVLKPSSMLQANGNPAAAVPGVTVQYDRTYALFPATLLSETNLRLDQVFDLGTGNLIKQLGPNSIVVSSCAPKGGPCTATQVFAAQVFTYDGLGRLLTHAVPVEDPTAGYRTEVVRRLDYSHFDENYVTDRLKLDSGPTSRWIATRTFFDGVGRRTAQHTSSDGQMLASVPDAPGSNTFQFYRYDARGALASVVAPHPGNDSLAVTEAYNYDGRGRLIRTLRTDGNSGLLSYAPWEARVTDAQGKVTVHTYDGFGRLLRVDQGATGSAGSRTSYDYDLADRLRGVRDADGNETVISYDGQGHRLSITRPGGRVWRFFYHPNGELFRQTDPDGRVSSLSYHPQGRIIDEGDGAKLDPDPATAARLAIELGIGRIRYFYDGPSLPFDPAIGSFRNRSGCLSGVQLFAGQSVDPYATMSYGYDAVGNLTDEVWTINLPQTGNRIFRFSRAFNPQGLLLRQTYPDGRTAAWTYDQRGQLETVTAANQILTTYQYYLSGLVKTRSALAGAGTLQQTHVYDYDALRRVTSDLLTVGASQTLHRSYHYTPEDNLDNLNVDDHLSDGLLQSTFVFQFDDLHRLTTARASPTPSLSYQASFTYSPAGNIASATVLGSFTSVPQRDQVQYQYDSTGVAADVHGVTALRDRTGRNLAIFAYDVRQSEYSNGRSAGGHRGAGEPLRRSGTSPDKSL